MVRWTWWHRLGSAVLVPLMMGGGPLLGQVTEKYDPIRQISTQVVPANLMIVLDRSGSMAQDRYGNGFVRGRGPDQKYFTADDEFGYVDANNVFHAGVPYGAPMVDVPTVVDALGNTVQVGPLDNPPNLALPASVARKIPGENSTGHLRWKAAEPAGCPAAGTGLTGLYLDGPGWQIPGNGSSNGTADIRFLAGPSDPVNPPDGPIDFAWTFAAPPPGGTGDLNDPYVEHFSVRWKGQLEPLYGEDYTLYVTADDGVKVWIGGSLVLDKWFDHGPTTYGVGPFHWSACDRRDVVIEYYQNGGGATIKLEWESLSESRKVIPRSALYPSPVGVATITPTPTATNTPAATARRPRRSAHTAPAPRAMNSASE